MPEGPELHLSSLFVNKICKNRIFSGKVEKSAVNWKNPEVAWDCPAYSIHAISRGKEVKLTLTEVTTSPNANDTQPRVDDDKKKAKLPKITSILFRFGMSGCFKFGGLAERHKHAHLNFYTLDGANVLSFVDVRRFGRWEVGADWSPERGPCVIYEYPAFREKVLNNLDKAAFNRPICEVLLNQSYFNGIGNYLRAEILYRLSIPPFACARDVLNPLVSDGQGEQATDHKKVKVKQETEQSEADLLQLCNKLPLEVVNLGGTAYTLESDDYSSFSDWLQCYYKPDMKNMVDHNGRTIWFQGPAGTLVPKENKTKKRKTKTKLDKGAKKEKEEISDREEPSNKKSRRRNDPKSCQSAEGTRRSKRSTQKKNYVEPEDNETDVKTRSARTKKKAPVKESSLKKENVGHTQNHDKETRRRSLRVTNASNTSEEMTKEPKSKKMASRSKSVSQKDIKKTGQTARKTRSSKKTPQKNV